MTNASSSATLLRSGPYCASTGRLYRDSTYAGAPVWDAERWWWTSHLGGCKLPGNVTPLAPQRSIRLAGPGFEPVDVLGDSLPPGRYWAAVPIRVATPAGDTTALVPGGAIDLTR